MENKLKMFLAGTLATTTLGLTARAQSADALIDKLVDKGILTVKEANELREESDKDFTTAFQTKTGMPDWVKNYKLSGDFRGRFDGMFANDMAPANFGALGPSVAQNFADRYRMRYQLRIGLTVNMQDDMEVGFRLGSGDASGSPLSDNTTLASNGTKKPIWVDTAYGRWMPLHAGSWNLVVTMGKMEQPFKTTTMVFDPDYTPEGAATQLTYSFNDQQSLRFVGGLFVLDELQFSGSDPYYSGGQAIWDASWTPKLDTSLSLSMFDLANKSNLSAKPGPNGGGIAYNNVGNTREFNSGYGNLVYDYSPIVASGSITYKLDTFPFYNGVFPIKAAGEFMHNPGAPTHNEGWWAGVTFGKAGTKGNWDVSYRYEYLEADAWYDQVVDDDNVGFYAARTPGTAGSYPYNFNDNELSAGTTKGGLAGGTNVKGHFVKFNYSLTDSLTLSFTAYLNSLIIPVPSVYQSAAVHIMGDMQWKF